MLWRIQEGFAAARHCAQTYIQYSRYRCKHMSSTSSNIFSGTFNPYVCCPFLFIHSLAIPFSHLLAITLHPRLLRNNPFIQELAIHLHLNPPYLSSSKRWLPPSSKKWLSPSLAIPLPSVRYSFSSKYTVVLAKAMYQSFSVLLRMQSRFTGYYNLFNPIVGHLIYQMITISLFLENGLAPLFNDGHPLSTKGVAILFLIPWRPSNSWLFPIPHAFSYPLSFKLSLPTPPPYFWLLPFIPVLATPPAYTPIFQALCDGN